MLSDFAKRTKIAANSSVTDNISYEAYSLYIGAKRKLSLHVHENNLTKHRPPLREWKRVSGKKHHYNNACHNGLQYNLRGIFS